jgi:hypothetical protein
MSSRTAYSELFSNDLDKNRALTPEQLVSEAERIVYNNDQRILYTRLVGIINRMKYFLTGNDFMLNSVGSPTKRSELVDRTHRVIKEATRKLGTDGRGKRRKNTMRKQPKRRRSTRRVR